MKLTSISTNWAKWKGSVQTSSGYLYLTHNSVQAENFGILYKIFLLVRKRSEIVLALCAVNVRVADTGMVRTIALCLHTVQDTQRREALVRTNQGSLSRAALTPSWKWEHFVLWHSFICREDGLSVVSSRLCLSLMVASSRQCCSSCVRRSADRTRVCLCACVCVCASVRVCVCACV